jgi:hypothetical protein
MFHDEKEEDFPVRKLITLENPVSQGSYLTQHFVYPVSSSVGAKMMRRFSHFTWLRDTLQRIFPGLFVPSLPPKQLPVNKFAKDIAEERKPELEDWLNRVLGMPILGECSEFKTFLSHNNIDDFIKSYIQQSDNLILANYMATYPALAEVPRVPEAECEEISKLHQSFHTLVDRLTILAAASHDLSASVKTYIDHLETFNKDMGQLYSAENGTSFESQLRPQRTDVMNEFARLYTAAKDLPQLYQQKWALLFKMQLDDIKAMSEAFDTWRRLMDSRAKATELADRWRTAPGVAVSKRTSAMGLFASLKNTVAGGAKKSEEDLKREEMQKEEDLFRLTTLVSLVILRHELPTFWRLQTESFASSCTVFADTQLTLAKEMETVWSGLLAAVE